MNIIDTYESASSLQAKRVTSNEYAAPCPVCGGEDRLRMWIKSREEHRYPNGNFYCRQCGASGGPERLAMLISSSSGENRAAVQRNFTKSTFLQTQRTIPVPPAITDAGYLNIVHEAKKHLRDNRSNAQVLQFLQSRGLTIETAVKYGLGYIVSGYLYTPHYEEGLYAEASYRLGYPQLS